MYKKRALQIIQRLFGKLGYTGIKKEKKYVNKYSYLIKSEILILIYQMGKVASRTIEKTLNENKYQTLHTHYLSEKLRREQLAVFSHEDSILEYYKDMKKVINWNASSTIYLHAIRNRINQKKSIKVITACRDPIGFIVSAFFQSYDKFYKKRIKNNYPGDEKERIISFINHAVSIYLSDYKKSSDVKNIRYKMDGPVIRRFILTCNIPKIWFDWELKNVLGIDVFKHDFNKTLGYQIINNEIADVLVFKFENLKNVLKPCLESFLHKEITMLIGDNISTNKTYWDVYNDVRVSLKFPLQFIDKMYNTKYVKHFYCKKEIEKFEMFWKN